MTPQPDRDQLTTSPPSAAGALSTGAQPRSLRPSRRRKLVLRLLSVLVGGPVLLLLALLGFSISLELNDSMTALALLAIVRGGYFAGVPFWLYTRGRRRRFWTGFLLVAMTYLFFAPWTEVSRAGSPTLAVWEALHRFRSFHYYQWAQQHPWIEQFDWLLDWLFLDWRVHNVWVELDLTLNLLLGLALSLSLLAAALTARLLP